MTEEDEIAQRELINWGILERNKVNEILPTVDFMVWLNDYIYAEGANGSLEGLDVDDDAAVTTLQSDFIKNQIRGWTTQRVHDGHLYAELEVSRHTKIVREIIQDISDRVFERYNLKIGEKGRLPIFYDDETGVSADPNKGETKEDFERKIEEYKTEISKEMVAEQRQYRSIEELDELIRQSQKNKQEKKLVERESEKSKSSEFDTKLDGFY